MIKKYLDNRDGSSGVFTVILTAALIIFVLFPVFSVVFEKHLINVKGQMLKDAIDITNIAAYDSLRALQASKGSVDMSSMDIQEIFKKLLAKNLNLNEDLTPKENSIAEGTVVIESIEVYIENFPALCPLGKVIERASVHSIITVPIKPSLYRGFILNAIGKQYIDLNIHVDSEIPLNN